MMRLLHRGNSTEGGTTVLCDMRTLEISMECLQFRLIHSGRYTGNIEPVNGSRSRKASHDSCSGRQGNENGRR